MNIKDEAVVAAAEAIKNGRPFRHAETARAALTAALPHMGGVEIKPLEWEDADEGMCTKWRAAALGGHYELVSFGKEPGFAVNFFWGRPLSFWFIQGNPDEWGPTGPKMFPTLEAAKAAAQADYERRILSAIEPSQAPQASPAPDELEVVALPGIDGQVLTDIAQRGEDDEYQNSPAWLWFGDHLTTFGRWNKGDQVAYIRGDIALRRAKAKR